MPYQPGPHPTVPEQGKLEIRQLHDDEEGPQLSQPAGLEQQGPQPGTSIAKPETNVSATQP